MRAAQLQSSTTIAGVRHAAVTDFAQVTHDVASRSVSRTCTKTSTDSMVCRHLREEYPDEQFLVICSPRWVPMTLSPRRSPIRCWPETSITRRLHRIGLKIIEETVSFTAVVARNAKSRGKCSPASSVDTPLRRGAHAFEVDMIAFLPAAARLQPLVVEVDPDMARLAAQDPDGGVTMTLARLDEFSRVPWLRAAALAPSMSSRSSTRGARCRSRVTQLPIVLQIQRERRPLPMEPSPNRMATKAIALSASVPCVLHLDHP